MTETETDSTHSQDQSPPIPEMEGEATAESKEAAVGEKILGEEIVIQGASLKDELNEVMEYTNAEGKYATGQWSILPCGCMAFTLMWTETQIDRELPPPIKAPCCGLEALILNDDGHTSLIRRHKLDCGMYASCVDHLY